MRFIAKTLLFLSVLFLGGQSFASTVDATLYFTDYTSRPLNVRQLMVTPLCRGGDYSGTNLSSRPITFTSTAYPSMTNGLFTVSNMVSGFAYDIAISDSYTVTHVTNYFATGLTGSVNAVDYKGVILYQTGGVMFQFAYFYQTNSSGSGTINYNLLYSTNLPYLGLSLAARQSITNAAIGSGTNYNLGTSTNLPYAGLAAAAQNQIETNAAWQARIATNGLSPLDPRFASTPNTISPASNNFSVPGTITAATGTFGSVSGSGSGLLNLPAAQLTGTVPNTTLGTSGTRDASTYYRGDGVFAPVTDISGGGGGAATNIFWANGDPNTVITAVRPSLTYDDDGNIWLKSGSGTDAVWDQVIAFTTPAAASSYEPSLPSVIGNILYVVGSPEGVTTAARPAITYTSTGDLWVKLSTGTNNVGWGHVLEF